MNGHQLGVIGYGNIGPWHVNKLTAGVPEIKIAGVYDIRPEIQRKIERDGQRAYRSLDELLNDPDVDIITVATPNDTHKPLVIQCLKAGKNVLCEKPVALNAASLQEMIDVADKTGKLFSVHQNRRWDKDYQMIKRVLGSKQIGTPYFIESRVQGARGALIGWRGHKINGGGMVYDWGVHLLDQALDLIDSRVVSVDAHLFDIVTNEVDDNIKILLRFENRVSYLLEMSTNCFVSLPRWHVSCTEGTAVIHNWDCEGSLERIKPSEKEAVMYEDITYTTAGPTRTMAPIPDCTKECLPLPSVDAEWSEYYKNIINVLDSKAELIVTPAQAMRVMKVLDAVFESERIGHGIQCSI